MSAKISKPKFTSRPGQVDFTNVRWAPVVNCVVKFQDRFLVVQRIKELNFYPGYWNGVSGFLDDQRSLQEKVEDELQEELGVPNEKINQIKLGEIFDQEEPKYNKTWIVHPVFVEVDTNKVKLDWEARSYKWVNLEEVRELNLLPGFDQVLEKLSKWLV